jgi:hypothetical protein
VFIGEMLGEVGTPPGAQTVVRVKTGSLERLDKLAVQPRDFPVFCIKAKDTVSILGVEFGADELLAVETPYASAPRRSLLTPDDFVTRNTIVSTSYETDIHSDLPPEYFVVVPQGIDVSVYRFSMVEFGGIGDPGNAVNQLIERGRDTLTRRREELAGKAADAVAMALGAAVPGAGDIGAGIARSLVREFIDFLIGLVLRLTEVGAEYPPLAVAHLTVDDLSVASAYRFPVGDQLRVEPVRLARLRQGDGGQVEITDGVRFARDAFERAWIGASAPSPPLAVGLNALGGRSVHWREPLQVGPGDVDGLQRLGVSVSAQGGALLAFRGFGAVIRLDLGGDASCLVAVRADTRQLAADDPRLPPPVNPL